MVPNNQIVTVRENLLSGKEEGVFARGEYKLDELDQVEGPVKLVFSAQFATSSFFLGLFSPSLENLGGDKEFWSHYQIEADYLVEDTIRDAIKYAATHDTALTEPASRMAN